MFLKEKEADLVDSASFSITSRIEAGAINSEL